MQLNDLIETNLFDDLSDQEQEVVAGGVSYTGSGSYGAYSYTPGKVGGFSFTTKDGKTYSYKWNGTSAPTAG